MNHEFTCPQCGALPGKISGNNDPLHCEYCGTTLSTGQVRAKSSPAPVSLASSGLLAKYGSLQRPKPSTPLEGAGCSIIFSLVWTLFSSIFVILGIGVFVRDFLDYSRLLREGVTVQATITQLEIDDSGDSTSYNVYYQFIGPKNNSLTRIDASESVSSKLYYTLRVEQKIDIFYATSDPTLSAIKAEFGPPNLWFALIFSGVGGLFVTIGLVLLYGGLRALQHLRRLRSEGLQTQGVLFDRWQDKDSDGDPTYFVAFAFKALSTNGSQQIYTHAEQNKNLYDQYQIGAALTVNYVPDDPSICLVHVER